MESEFRKLSTLLHFGGLGSGVRIKGMMLWLRGSELSVFMV